jgi:hypothetical protein
MKRSFTDRPIGFNGINPERRSDMKTKHVVAVLAIAVVTMVAGIVGHHLKKCPKCPEQKERVPSITNCSQKAKTPKFVPKKIIRARRRPGLEWKGVRLPTNLVEAHAQADKLLGRYVRACKKQFLQGPIYKGYFSCIRWNKIHEEWLDGVDKQKDPRIEFWVRLMAQHMMGSLGKLICDNDHHVKVFTEALTKLPSNKRKEALGVLKKLQRHAAKNKKRFEAHVAEHKKKGLELPGILMTDLNNCRFNRRTRSYEWIQI